MKKQLLKGVEARRKLQDGVNKIADIVTTTLGPRGRNVAIGRPTGAPVVSHDGATVARSINLEDPFEDQGAQLVKLASEKTNTAAGDGTTTAMLLAQKIIKYGMKATTKDVGDLTGKVNAMKLRKELENASDKVIEEIKNLATKITTHEQKKNIANISAQDEEIGGLIADALKLVGDNGIVTVGTGSGADTVIEHSEGLQISQGMVSPYFITNNSNGSTEIKDASILVTDLDIPSLEGMLGFFDTFLKKINKLLIIANSFEEKAIVMLVMNKERAALHPIAIKAPAFGPRRINALKDIALATGATFISRDLDRKLTSITVEELGFASSVKATMEETLIIGGGGDKKAIAAKVKELKARLKNTDKDVEKLKIEERLAKLSNGIAVIHAGGNTEAEVIEKRFRIEDAVHATRAAIEEGIVPGGGTILLKAREVLKQETDGERILYSALEQPIRKVLENAGEDVDEILGKLNGKGYDVVGEKFCDMLDSGIIDPAKVTIEALQNAVSVASMVLTTEAIVVDLPDADETISKTV